MRRLSFIYLPVLIVALTACVGVVAGGYAQYTVSLAVTAMSIGASLVLVVGLARMITLASAAMMGLGAYGLAILMVRYQVDIAVGLLAATIIGTVAGLILGVLTARFRGHYLAMATLVFESVTIIVLRQWSDLTGGAQGLHVPTGAIFNIAVDSETKLLIVSAGVAMISIGLIAVLSYGHLGKGLQALAATEVGAEAFGIDGAAYRTAAFAASSGTIALAGAVQGLQVHLLDPEAYGLLKSISMLAYPIVGGMTSIWGGIIGGGMLRLLPEMLRFVRDYQELLYGALVIAIVLICPDGIVGLIQRYASGRSSDSNTAIAVTRNRVERNHTSSISVGKPSTVHSFAPALVISDASKSFGGLAALKNVSLTVPAGSIYGMIGPNGAGKTTLFNLVSGFTAPDNGIIELFGKQLKPLAVTERVGMGITRTFQNVAIYGPLSCLDNVLIGLGQNEVVRALWQSVEDCVDAANAMQRRRRAMESLEVVGLGHVAHRTAGFLSLGEQRRLEIARAIVSRPRLLMLDEPVSGLDMNEQETIANLLEDINARYGTTMFVIEHNIQFVAKLSRTLCVLHMGSILVEGEPQTVINMAEVSRIYFGTAEKVA